MERAKKAPAKKPAKAPAKLPAKAPAKPPARPPTPPAGPSKPPSRPPTPPPPASKPPSRPTTPPPPAKKPKGAPKPQPCATIQDCTSCIQNKCHFDKSTFTCANAGGNPLNKITTRTGCPQMLQMQQVRSSISLSCRFFLMQSTRSSLSLVQHELVSPLPL